MTDSSTPKVEVPLRFKDGTITIREMSLLQSSTLLVRAIEGWHCDWEENGVVLNEPIDIPFVKAAGEFLFENVHCYVNPQKLEKEPTLSDYPGAPELRLELAKQVIELANYLEYSDFVECMGFVIAQKIERMPVRDIANYMGLQYVEDDGYDEDFEKINDLSDDIRRVDSFPTRQLPEGDAGIRAGLGAVRRDIPMAKVLFVAGQEEGA
ncbi:unnamed protein product [Caenorhabditis sp. 36 PRJEB53466]|nr:unnamed protein product [Caenorhabditis sp. 36 PRJEB53466]